MKTRYLVHACLATLLCGALASGQSCPAAGAEPGSKKIKVLVYGGGSVHDFKGINRP